MFQKEKNRNENIYESWVGENLFINTYITNSTKEEIEFSKSLDKEIIYYTDLVYNLIYKNINHCFLMVFLYNKKRI